MVGEKADLRELKRGKMTDLKMEQLLDTKLASMLGGNWETYLEQMMDLL